MFGHMEVPGVSWNFFDGFFYIYSGYTVDHITIASFKFRVPTQLYISQKIIWYRIYFEYFQVLSDPEKKRQYDLHGPMESQNSRPSRGRHGFYEQDPTHGFESDMSAEEIFNMFFGEIDFFLLFLGCLNHKWIKKLNKVSK